MRPPAVPLIAHDPYFSIWSAADRLNAAPTSHWTGTEQPITGLVLIDGKIHRLMGGGLRWSEAAPALKQLSLTVTPTRTMYKFDGAGIALDLTFLTPALPDDLDVLSRPVTYLIWDVRSPDGKPHKVKLYLDCASHLVVDRSSQRAMWSRHSIDGMDIVRMGSMEQNVLSRSGDDLRIDWGHLYLAVPKHAGATQIVGTMTSARPRYLATLDLPTWREFDLPVQTDRDVPLIAVTLDLGTVGRETVSRHALIAYDDLFAIEYFQRKLRPYWRRKGMSAEELLKTAEREFVALKARSERFDAELTADLVAAGGPKYAALAVLAYRQALAAHKLAADWDGTPLHFSKENFSNGCIATVDVTYPGAPLFLLLNPQLLKAQLRPVLDYALAGRWPWPYAPHDLGQYPLANGQVYGGREETEDRQMPVEESGNMLILMAALAQAEGNAEFSRPYWPLLAKWAAYLRKEGLDPANQLNTDDFAGHMAHNTNLSIKAIVALGAYGQLAKALGQAPAADEYGSLSRKMASEWLRMAADGDHYRLAFDQPGTWSQKYNLVWDKLLGLKLFPGEVASKEIAYYKTKQKAFGLPLDNRSDYTKLDWIVWTATLAASRADFITLTDPAYKFANETATRVPLSDWYWTNDGTQRGFQARSVVGGVFIKMMDSPERWKKWVAHSTK